MTPRRALAYLIGISAIVRLVAASLLGLGNDEAYHFLYSAHPALSYYDHPPMLAWTELAGLLLTRATYSAVALRLGFIVLFAGSTWLMARIAGRWFGQWAGFYAALALNLTAYYGLAAATFALPDGPLLFFWLLTLDRLTVAVEDGRKTTPWLAVGLAWGCAMLSKYHAIFLPAGAVMYLLVTPSKRRILLQPGPYIAVLTGLAVFSPVLAWNASHGWASFLFQGGRAVGGLTPRPDFLATALLAQVGYLFPWIWLPLMAILFRELRAWKRLRSEGERLALCVAILPFAAFTAVACFRPVLPHWGLIGLVSLFPSLGKLWAEIAARNPARMRRSMTMAGGFSLVLLGLTLAEYHTGFLQRVPGSSWGLFKAQADPTGDLYGWDEVATRLEEMGALSDPDGFLVTRLWYQSAQVSHAIRMKRPVLCYNIDDPRGFAFWSTPSDFVGRDAVLLVINDDPVSLPFYRRWFADASSLGEFTIERRGKPLRKVQAYRLSNQLASFPYTFSPERTAARETLRAGGHPLDARPEAIGRSAPGASMIR
ncbi:glycosyltransferase family 39 protein [Aquisphaera insulae]|uniref:glycosyltransferase family 39 protein n=1 Tax=Aquisphaera insulae TaxID=2712864 RepID=UPI0013EB8401|nr:glycosyltransferase family 39 protein [Aquisphaera insulae]